MIELIEVFNYTYGELYANTYIEEITTLNHEIFDNSMELCSLVACR